MAMSHGYDEAQVMAYIDALKAIVLTEAAQEVKDIHEIQTACEENWQGKARENFVLNVGNDANFVSVQYEALFNTLYAEINNIRGVMADFDSKLIKY